MHYYQHNVGEFALDTQGLSLAHVGAYMRLVDRYVATEKPIKTEWVSVAFGSDSSIAHEILAAFFEPAEGTDGWVHPRLAAEIEAYKARAEANKANGKRGGRPKKPKETDSVSSGFQNETESEAKKSLTNNHKPVTNKETLLTESKERRAAASRRKIATECPFAAGERIPPDYFEIGKKLGVDDPERQFFCFVDHAVATGRTLIDWKAGFRMWCNRDLQWHPSEAAREAKRQADVDRVLAKLDAEDRAKAKAEAEAKEKAKAKAAPVPHIDPRPVYVPTEEDLKEFF